MKTSPPRPAALVNVFAKSGLNGRAAPREALFRAEALAHAKSRHRHTELPLHAPWVRVCAWLALALAAGLALLLWLAPHSARLPVHGQLEAAPPPLGAAAAAIETSWQLRLPDPAPALAALPAGSRVQLLTPALAHGAALEGHVASDPERARALPPAVRLVVQVPATACDGAGCTVQAGMAIEGQLVLPARPLHAWLLERWRPPAAGR